MKRIGYAVILGATLGALDGLTAAYEFGFGSKVLTLAGLSSIKSLIVGLLVGIVACFVRNKGVVIAVGTIVALIFAYLVASAPDPDTGEKYYVHIMATGGLVGLLVGYATVKFAEKADGMSSVDKALETQLANLQKRAGKSLAELYAIIRKSGVTKFGEIREMLKRDLGMGHGDANTLVHAYVAATAGPASEAAGDPLDTIYSGAKADLRPIHDKLMKAISGFGPFETAPKKAYVSLRRKKQFATIGPATNSRVDVGLNMKGVPPTTRLILLPPGGMCQYRISVTKLSEVDVELTAWIKQAYEGSG